MKMPDVKRITADQTAKMLEDSVILADLPVLNRFLLEQEWEESVPKGERSLMLFFKTTGVCSGVLKVSNPPLKMSVMGASPDEVLAGMEACLRQEYPPFVTDDRPIGQAGKKSK